MDEKRNERERDTVLKAMEHCLTRIESTLELLFPPLDASAEVRMAAQQTQESRMREVTALLREERKTLGEFVRRYCRLSRQSLPKPERATSPDEFVGDSLEDARILEGLSRKAQEALRAQAKELPCPTRELDMAFQSVEWLLFACIKATSDLLFPPLDASAELRMAAQQTQESRMCEVTALWTEERLTLQQIGQLRLPLSEQATAVREWANVPDVLIPTTLEEARLLKRISKHDSGEAPLEEAAVQQIPSA